LVSCRAAFGSHLLALFKSSAAILGCENLRLSPRLSFVTPMIVRSGIDTIGAKDIELRSTDPKRSGAAFGRERARVAQRRSPESGNAEMT